MNFLSKMFHAIGHVFVVIFGKQQLQDLAKAAEGILMSDFGKIVMVVVENLQGIAAGNSDQARKDAFVKIEQAAIAQGKSLPASMINLLIELAVQRLKGTFNHQEPDPAPVVPAEPAK